MPDIQMLTRDEVTYRVRQVLNRHRGAHNKIMRKELVEQVYGQGAVLNWDNNNAYDRVVREVIEAYRDQDLIVSTTKDGGGYWLAESITEAEQIAESYEKRGRRMGQKARIVRERARETFGQQFPLGL